MIRVISIFLLCFIYANGLMAQTSKNASQVLNEAIKVINGGKAIDASFKISNQGYTGGGNIKVSGSKFSLKMPDVEIWYNGKEMYTYNKNTGETTVVNPTDEELAETNPLHYISGVSGKYNVAFSTVKHSGKYVLELIPKQKGGEVKRVTLTLRQSDYFPEKIVVEPSSGSPIAADITTFRLVSSISPGEFEYPKTKYPNVEIVDLR